MTHRLSRRTRALLAGGVVLGLGATVTLAAYSDSEWVSSTFSAAAVEPDQVLELEGSTDNTSYSEEVSLHLTLDALAMETDQTYYAPLYLRTTRDTTVDATIAAGPPTVGGSPDLASQVAVDIVHATNLRCDHDIQGESVGGGQGLGDATVAGDRVRIDAGPADQPSDLTMLCFQFTLTERPGGTAPHTATATWTVTATQAATTP